MRRLLSLTFLLTLAATLQSAATLTAQGMPPGLYPRNVTGAARLTEALPMAPDTLVMTASWTLPASDGFGPLDSVRVVFRGVMRDTVMTWRTPAPTSASWRHVIPPEAYGSGTSGCSATYATKVQAVTFRRGVASPWVESPAVTVVLNCPAPPPLTGVTHTAVKRP